MPSNPAPSPFTHLASYPHGGVLYALCRDEACHDGACHDGAGQDGAGQDGAGQDGKGGRLFVAGSDARVHVLQLGVEQPKLEPTWILHDNYISGLALVGGRLVSSGYDGRLLWSDPDTGQVLRDVVAHQGWVRDVAGFPDESRVVSVGDDMRVNVWDPRGKLALSLAGHAPRTPQGYHSALYCVAVSPDGRHVASGDRVGEVRVWDSESGRLVQQLSAPDFYTYDPEKRDRSIGGIRALRFSDDGRRLAISGIGQVTNVDGFVGPCRVEVWEWETKQRQFTGQHDHKAVLNDVHFHDDWILAAGGGDGGGVLIAWKLDQPGVSQLAKPKGHVQRLCLDPVRSQVYAAGYESLQVWSMQLDGAARTTT